MGALGSGVHTVRGVLMMCVFFFVKGAKCRRSAGGAAGRCKEAGLPDSRSLRVGQSHECVSIEIHLFNLCLRRCLP